LNRHISFAFVMTIEFQTGEEGKVDDSYVPDKDVQKDRIPRG
jgi:hypothetical protein